jgi:hypothetical protein
LFCNSYFSDTSIVIFQQKLNTKYYLKIANIFEEPKRWLDIEKDESTYKRDLQKRIELINWGLEHLKDPNVQICVLIESK